MAIAGTLTTLQVGGRLFQTDEWSISLHLHSTQTLEPVSPAVIGAMIYDWYRLPLAGFSPASTVEYVKHNIIDPVSGRYADATNSHTYISDPIPSGGGSGVYGSPQDTIAVSLTTGAVRGPAHAGRFYPPLQAFSLGSDGRMSVQQATDYATSAKNLLDYINDLAGDFAVCVYSKRYQVVKPVTGVRVGRVVDTQRRRRNSLAEEWEPLPLL